MFPSIDFAPARPSSQAHSTRARARAPNTHSDCNHAGADGKRRAELVRVPLALRRRRAANRDVPSEPRRHPRRATNLRISGHARFGGRCRPSPNRRCARSERKRGDSRTIGIRAVQWDVRTADSAAMEEAGAAPNSARRQSPALGDRGLARTRRKRLEERDRRTRRERARPLVAHGELLH